MSILLTISRVRRQLIINKQLFAISLGHRRMYGYIRFACPTRGQSNHYIIKLYVAPHSSHLFPFASSSRLILYSLLPCVLHVSERKLTARGKSLAYPCCARHSSIPVNIHIPDHWSSLLFAARGLI